MMATVHDFKYPTASPLSIKMPKEGFTGITIALDLKQRLTETAKAYGFPSVPALVEGLLSGTVPGTGTSEPSPSWSARGVDEPTCPLNRNWCGGRDLNPRRPTPEDLKSSPLS